MNYKNEQYKTFDREYESNFSDYRDENVEEKEIYIKKKLGELPIHQLIRQLKIIELLWDFDCVSLYPSAMWDRDSICPKMETGYAYTPDLNDERVENFNIQIFTQRSAILKIKYFNPKN